MPPLVRAYGLPWGERGGRPGACRRGLRGDSKTRTGEGVVGGDKGDGEGRRRGESVAAGAGGGSRGVPARASWGRRGARKQGV